MGAERKKEKASRHGDMFRADLTEKNRVGWGKGRRRRVPDD